ncbi:MAG TPA: hypothetical protein VF157_08755, partial [Chloroflexota bacterium]
MRTLAFLLLVLVVGGGAAFAYLFYFRPVAEAVSTATGQVVPRLPVITTDSSGAPVAAAAAATVPSLSGTSRVNVLLLGSDTDAKFAGDYNTQIMI